MKHIMKVALILLAFFALLGFVLNLAQNTRCDLESLIVQDNMMPSEWKRLWQVLPPALPLHGAQDALNVVYENENEIAQHTIYRFKNGLLAYFFFWVNNQVFFPSGLWVWSDLDDRKGWELNGDTEKIQCGDSDDPLLGSICVGVIRYGPFISDFSSPVGEGIMSQDEFKAIVLAIDDRIASCIQQLEKIR